MGGNFHRGDTDPPSEQGLVLALRRRGATQKHDGSTDRFDTKVFRIKQKQNPVKVQRLDFTDATQAPNSDSMPC
ncbi:hypothetical protein BaRGS_00005597 [Batillaria attramentaria]|uniref:Uncharacterized protein n=1 Tax=Batillaria attramentaria TaxID=370345 RepID=A0ABD0LV11_9CAEN